MEPTNAKHLLHILTDTIDKVRSKEITVARAAVVSDLAARCNTIFKLEHDRPRVIMEIERHKERFRDSKAELRNVEGKNFD